MGYAIELELCARSVSACVEQAFSTSYIKVIHLVRVTGLESTQSCKVFLGRTGSATLAKPANNLRRLRISWMKLGVYEKGVHTMITLCIIRSPLLL